MADKSACQGVTISGNASYGNDPVPLYEAGKKNIACVIELEALGQIQVSRATFDNNVGTATGDCTFGGVTITNGIKKYNITAQSGQAYFVDTLICVGRAE